MFFVNVKTRRFPALELHNMWNSFQEPEDIQPALQSVIRIYKGWLQLQGISLDHFGKLLHLGQMVDADVIVDFQGGSFTQAYHLDCLTGQTTPEQLLILLIWVYDQFIQYVVYHGTLSYAAFGCLPEKLFDNEQLRMGVILDKTTGNGCGIK